MEKRIVLLWALALAGVIAGCSRDEEIATPSGLVKSWTQSFEENTSEEAEVYRPSDFQVFPPSRYRQVFDFRADGGCDYRVLAPNDAHYFQAGRWEYHEATKTITIFNPRRELVYEVEVIFLAENMLKLGAK